MIHVKYDGNYYYALSSDGINFSEYCYCFDKMVNKWLHRDFYSRSFPVWQKDLLQALIAFQRKQKLEKLLA